MSRTCNASFLFAPLAARVPLFRFYTPIQPLIRYVFIKYKHCFVSPIINNFNILDIYNKM